MVLYFFDIWLYLYDNIYIYTYNYPYKVRRMSIKMFPLGREVVDDFLPRSSLLISVI